MAHQYFSSLIYEMKLKREVHKGLVRLDKINYFQFQVVLIPKSRALSKVGDHRLIFLLNNSLKTISKILANRLSTVLQDLIIDYQSDFVSSRYILKSLMLRQSSTNIKN